MAAQKRKSVLVEPPAKRRKLDKNSKSVPAGKGRKSLDVKSNKNKALKKEILNTSIKTIRSAVNKTINKCSVASSHIKRAQKHSKQTLNELKKITGKRVCLKQTSLKSSGKSSTKTPPKSSKVKRANGVTSTKTSSKICSREKGKSKPVKKKASCEGKNQKHSSANTERCSSETLCDRRSTMCNRTACKKVTFEIKSVKENSERNKCIKDGKFLKNTNSASEVQNTKNPSAKKAVSQKIERTWTLNNRKSSDKDKIATRTTDTNSSKSHVRAAQEQLNCTKTKEVSQKEMIQGHPTVLPDDHQTRKSPRLQQTNVPTISLRSRKINEECASTKKQCSKMKEKVPSVKHEKPNIVQQKKTKKNDECKIRDGAVSNFEKTDCLEGEKLENDLKSNYSATSQDKLGELKNNIGLCLQESGNGSVSMSSSSVSSACGTISKEKESLQKNGKNSVKAKKALPASSSPNVLYQAEDVMKSKKISILELCEEIAGEIESDTVEVKKDSLNCKYGKEEGRETVMELPQATVSAEQETSKNSQCKRFFPSKKGMSVKCTVNGRHSTANKNSKWTKIKLTKINHVNQRVSNSSSPPNIGFLKHNIPESQQTGTVEIHFPETQKKLLQSQDSGNTAHEQKLNTDCFKEINTKDRVAKENGVPEAKHCLEPASDESLNLHLESNPDSTPIKLIPANIPVKQGKKDTADVKSQDPAPKQLVRTLFTNKTSESSENRTCLQKISLVTKCDGLLSSEEHIQKLREAAKDSDKQLTIDAGQKRFGAISCNICGMLYTAANPEDETQHLLFHNQFISAVKYVGWKKERILAEYPDGKIIMVLPDDPKYALRKVDEIREMVDNDLGFQQAPLTSSRTKTLLFISNDKKVTGCLIAEHIQWGYRVIEDKNPDVYSENEKVTFERQKAWCCSTSPEPAICGISRIWVFSMMRRKKIASRMLECLRSNFIYGSYLSKEEIAFSDPTPDGKLFATQYFGTSQFLVYNFISGQQPA